MKKLTIREAGAKDLDETNRVVEAAFMTWDLPERVKRLSLPSYRYNEADLHHLHLVVAEVDDKLVGVAAWEPAEAQDCPPGRSGLLLHGLYVLPKHMRRGTGRALVREAEAAARQEGFDGLLVKAQSEAIGFFERAGFQALPVEDQARHYDKRFWKAVNETGWQD